MKIFPPAETSALYWSLAGCRPKLRCRGLGFVVFGEFLCPRFDSSCSVQYCAICGGLQTRTLHDLPCCLQPLTYVSQKSLQLPCASSQDMGGLNDGTISSILTAAVSTVVPPPSTKAKQLDSEVVPSVTSNYFIEVPLGGLRASYRSSRIWWLPLASKVLNAIEHLVKHR